jgi:hypothetical protein
MSEKDIRANPMTKYMEKHNNAFAAVSSTARRVKIEENHTWRLRILPVELGVEKDPFVTIAQHWYNNQPKTCPRHTPASWGGNPDYVCPICEISDHLRESGDEKINGFGYKLRCNIQIRAYCIVFDMEDQRGNVEEMPMSEVLNPYEFNMFKGTWENFSKFQKWATSRRRAGQEASPWGIIDLETGCDLLATHGSKGITLDKCDPGPIFPLDDPKFDEYTAKIWSRIKSPKIIIPDDKELLELAAKIEEKAERGVDEDDRGGNRRGGNREREDSNYRARSRNREDQDDAPPRQSRRVPPASDDGGDAPQTDAPPTRQSRRPAPAPAAETDDAPPPPARRAAARPPATEQAQEEEEQAPAPPPRRAASPPAAPPPAARKSAATAPPPAETNGDAQENGDDGDLAPARPPARRGTVPSSAQPGVDEEEDNAPEERNDPAPATREKPAEEPPPVGASAPPARKAPPRGDIRDRLARLNQKDRNQ